MYVVVFPDSGAWVAQCLELDICAHQGCSPRQAVENLRDTFCLYYVFAVLDGVKAFAVETRGETPVQAWDRFRESP